MSTNKSRKQRGLENMIRRIAFEVARKVAQREALTTCLREISVYDYEKSKPDVVTAEDLMKLFDLSYYFPSQHPKTKEDVDKQQADVKKHVEEMYKNIGVPYGTPLYYGEGLKLMVYPEGLLPTNYTPKKRHTQQ